MSPRDLLKALRECGTWDAAAAALGEEAGAVRSAADALLRSRVPAARGEVVAPGLSVRVARDQWGIPHVFAGSEIEAYYGLGFAMGQDRLWQMDYLRRAAYGTLAEVLGEAGLENDRVSRILGLARVARAAAEQLAGDAKELLEAFCGGVNLARAMAEREGLPFEFELLEYAPDPWRPEDTLAVLRGFWWYLTGRFSVICVPEFAARIMGDGPLLRAFLTPEGDQTTVWPRGLPYPDLPRHEGGRWDGGPPPGAAAAGSNNWVVAPSRSENGAPMLASDPHVPLVLPGVWYEARLRGGRLDACGVFAAGAPGIFFGRNRDLAWGLTNNISSLRDLYLEVTDDFDPDRYRRGNAWKGMEARREVIRVKDAQPIEIEVREVDHGPVVSDLLPPFARTGETVSLRWVGHEPTPEVDLMLRYARAGSVPEFRECLREWACPTFNFLLADRIGEIGYQLTGRIPLRGVARKGYLAGEEPSHAWTGFVPWDGLPATAEPPEGWLGSANNIVATEDWPYPLAGNWPSDYRMQRIAALLNRPGAISSDEVSRAQMDEHSPRAAEWAGPSITALRSAGVSDPLLDEIEAWDCVFDAASRPAAVWESFFVAWSRAVLNHRFPAGMLAYTFPLGPGLVERLFVEDHAGWFQPADARPEALRTAWREGVAWMEERLGPDRETWRWGAVHTLTLRHPLSTSPLLRELLDRGPYAHGGTWNTLNNSLYEPDRLFETFSGVSYRLRVDFAGETRGVNAGGQSGHPGSPHYVDQVSLWQGGGYHPLELGDEPPEGEVWVIRPE